MLSYLLLVTVLCILYLKPVNSASDTAVYRESAFELEHFISDRFITRSKYTIKHKIDGSHDINVVDSPNNGISSNQIPEFKNLLSANGLYRIQVTSIDENGATSSVSTALPVCDLQQSGFKEDIVLHLDNSDNVISVSYSSPIMAIIQPCNAKKVCDKRNRAAIKQSAFSTSTAEIKMSIKIAFQTRINVAEVEVAQSVPLQALGPKPMTLNHVNFGTDADPSAVPNQSFLRQYWYIVVPLMLVMLMGGGNGEEK